MVYYRLMVRICTTHISPSINSAGGTELPRSAASERRAKLHQEARAFADALEKEEEGEGSDERW